MHELNPRQQAAAQADDGPVMIVAGPGTGKTKTLAARIAYLINQARVSPEAILALTFTKKAAQELTSRIATVSQNSQQVRATTFHGICYEIIGEELVFATDSQIVQIIRSLKRPAALKGMAIRELALYISRAKNSPAASEHETLVADYNAALTAAGLSDYDDLLLCAKDVLVTNLEKRQYLQGRFTHLLVDEFQDTNLLQYEILRLLCGSHNLFVIGDPNQSIYGFRGASGTIFEQFRADFPHCTRIALTENYRSAAPIVRLSNAICGDQLVAASTLDGRVRAVEVLNEYSEADWVVSEIQRAIGGSDMLLASGHGTDARAYFRDFAILYRSRSVAKIMQRAIEASALPYQVVGEGSPYEQHDVQHIIEQLRLIEADAPPHERAERIIAGTAMPMTDALRQFVASLVRFATTQEALAYIDTLSEQQFYDPHADAITLLTIHAAKGLEFTHVFLIGAEEGVLPSSRGDEAEEKRLFYVAATRAKEFLDITHARYRVGKSAMVSQFIAGLPASLLPRIVDSALPADQRRAAKRKAKRAQATLF